MRRTSGSPASSTSSGMAIAVSSSSAPIAGFCAITLKTGADRSGNTSRRRSWSHSAPMTAPAATSSVVMSGVRSEARIVRSTMAASVIAVTGAGALGLRLQQERAVNDDGFAGREARKHLDLAAEVATPPDLPGFEDAGVPWYKHNPAVADPLHRGHWNREDRRAAGANRQRRRSGHARPQQLLAVAQLDAHVHGPRIGGHLARHHRDVAGESLARQRRERHLRGGAALDADGVALERVH